MKVRRIESLSMVHPITEVSGMGCRPAAQPAQTGCHSPAMTIMTNGPADSTSRISPAVAIASGITPASVLGWAPRSPYPFGLVRATPAGGFPLQYCVDGLYFSCAPYTQGCAHGSSPPCCPEVIASAAARGEEGR